MIAFKILILLGIFSSLACSLSIKKDEAIKYGNPVFTSNIEFTQINHEKIEGRLYVNEEYARYDFNLWGEANISEIIVKNDVNPIKATICKKHCDVSVLEFQPVFTIPQSADLVVDNEACPFDQTKMCDIWKFEIDDYLFGYGYVYQDQILAIEVKDSSNRMLTQTIFKDTQLSIPDSIFVIPDTCSCKGSVCFLIDGSESVLKESFSKTKEKITDVLNFENALSFEIQMCAVQFATRSKVISSMTDDKDNFLSALTNNTKLGGLTDIYAGLDGCVKELENSNQTSEKSIVIITDGSYTNHPQLKGDPRGYVASIHGKGISVRVGAIESELFYNEELITNISSSRKSIFKEEESVRGVASKVLNPLCVSDICKRLDCDKGYCGCGGCICPPGVEGDVCRRNNGGPEYGSPGKEPTFDGTDVVPPPESSSNTGAIVGGIIGALAGIAIIAAIVFAIVRRSRNSAAASAANGGAMTGNEAVNPVYEQQGVGGENPLYEG